MYKLFIRLTNSAYFMTTVNINTTFQVLLAAVTSAVSFVQHYHIPFL